MREILFRGKDIRGNCHIGLLARLGNAWYISNKAGIATAYEVIPETVGQYTGLTDKNGTRIFEGDIIRFSIKYTDKIVFFTGEVKWSGYGHYLVANKQARMADRPLGTTAHKSKVIGNIHDNSELLKGGADNA